MTRSYRNEAVANQAMADQAQAMAQTRADWRAVLESRDAKRESRRSALQRATRRSWFAQVFA